MLSHAVCFCDSSISAFVEASSRPVSVPSVVAVFSPRIFFFFFDLWHSLDAGHTDLIESVSAIKFVFSSAEMVVLTSAGANGNLLGEPGWKCWRYLRREYPEKRIGVKGDVICWASGAAAESPEVSSIT